MEKQRINNENQDRKTTGIRHDDRNDFHVVIGMLDNSSETKIEKNPQSRSNQLAAEDHRDCKLQNIKNDDNTNKIIQTTLIDRIIQRILPPSLPASLVRVPISS